MSLTLTLVDEGRAAFAKSSQDGTNAFTIARAVLGTTFYTFDSTRTEVVSQCDEATAGAIGSSSDEESGIISVALTFSGSEAYSAYELYVYATYDNDSDDHSAGDEFCLAACVSDSESEPIITKAASSRAIIYAYMLITDGDITDLTISNTELVVPAASQTIAGIARLATTDEVIAGLDSLITISPATLFAALSDNDYTAQFGMSGGITQWSSSATYSAGDLVYYVIDGVLVLGSSLTDNNTGNELTDANHWITTSWGSTTTTTTTEASIVSVDLTNTDGVLSGTITVTYTLDGAETTDVLTLTSATVDEDGNVTDAVWDTGSDTESSYTGLFSTITIETATWDDDTGLTGTLTASDSSGYYHMVINVEESEGTGTLYYTLSEDFATVISQLQSVITTLQQEVSALKSGSSSSSDDDDDDSSSSSTLSSGSIYGIGTAGEYNYGKGLPEYNETSSLSDLVNYGFSPLTGYDDRTSTNFAVYKSDSTGLTVMLVPAFYARSGKVGDDYDASYGACNKQTLTLEEYDKLSTAEQAYWFMPRGFFNGSSTQYCSFMFCMQYAATYSSGLLYGGLDYTPTVSTQLYNYVDYAKSHAGLHLMTVFDYAIIWHLALAHAQAVTSTDNAAWYDSTGTTNWPRPYAYQNGASLSSAANARTFSQTDSVRALNSHNGVLGGFMDWGLNWEFAMGMSTSGTSSTDTTSHVSDNSVYLFADNADAYEATSGYGSLATDLWGTSTFMTTTSTLYNPTAYSLPFTTSTTAKSLYGDASVEHWTSPHDGGNAWRAYGIMPGSDSALVSTSAYGNYLGYAYHNLYLRANHCPLFGPYWGASACSPFSRAWYYYRSYSSANFGFRASGHI